MIKNIIIAGLITACGILLSTTYNQHRMLVAYEHWVDYIRAEMETLNTSHKVLLETIQQIDRSKRIRR